ncbi:MULTISPECIES: GNAT family N-acetyltransferase [Halorussus]|uniref:GNAT family N-acetyltransferase n=1 Tax=Halorussus TaxID=1070314 RepID=UPI0020A14960|nr:hypothetical protein [Halorussus vallis]USZ77035.1 hypothetical protein NGM07_06835 [Halorussus vallis]
MTELFPATFETDRLRFERLCHENVDVLAFYGAFADGAVDPAVFEYVPQEPYRTPNEARDRIDSAESNWRDGRAAEYVVRVGSEDRRTGGGETADRLGDGEPRADELAGYATLHCE